MGIPRKWLALVTMFALLWGSIFSGIDIRTIQAAGVNPQSTGTIIYVKEGAAVGGSGSSWSDAFVTLQEALEQANSGDEIWIAAGTYLPTKDVSGAVPTSAVNKTFQMRPGVAIYGGFPAEATNGTGISARDWEMNKTILSGDLNRDDTDDLTVNKTDNANNVFHHRSQLGLEETAILDGVTISGGHSTNSSYHGAGIWNEGQLRSGIIENNSPTLRNVIITGNVTKGQGGGLYNEYGKLNMTNVTVSNNEATSGGGIYTSRGELTYVDGSIAHNTATGSGGGLAISNDGAYWNNVTQLTRVNISENYAKIINGHNGPGGGGIHFSYGTLKLTDLNISNNQTGSSGGGISGQGDPYSSEKGYNLQLFGVTVSDNTAGIDGGGISTRSKGALSIFGGEISNNRTNVLRSGGGIFNAGADMTLEHVLIQGNEAHAGGGVAISNAEATLTNVKLLENWGVHGGGLHIGASSPILTNVIIQGNTAQSPLTGSFQGSGGGIYNNSDNNGSGQPVLRNVLITGNVAEGKTANGHGGGIFDRGGAFSTLINVTIAHNYSNGDGGGYYMEGGATSLPVIRNSIIWGNEAGNSPLHNIRNTTTIANKPNLHIANSLVEDAYNLTEEWNKEFGTDGGGNLDGNPEFIAPILAAPIPSIAGDYSLEETSLAINKGDNTKVEVDVTTDLAGGPRISDGNVDLGAFELSLDNEAPIWPAGLDMLSVVAVPDTPTSVVVSWPEAGDNIGVKSYYLTMDDQQPNEFPGNIFEDTSTFEYMITDLPEPKIYTFKLVAVDVFNNRSAELIGTYELEEADIEPPAPGSFVVNWNIARSAYPFMLAMPESDLEITAIAEPGQTLEAVIHYESWLDTDGTPLGASRMVTDTVSLSVDQASPGQYQVRTPLLTNAGRIDSIDVIASNASGQTIVNKAVDLQVAAAYKIVDAKTSLGNHLIGSTMMLWSEELNQGNTIKVTAQDDTYTFSGIIPNKGYEFKVMEASTNRPLRVPESIIFLPGQVLSQKKTIPGPATLRLEITFAGGEVTVPDGLVVTVKDTTVHQMISTKITDSLQGWTRPASGKLLVGGDELQLEISGMEWPYVARQSEHITLGSGINNVTLDIGYADSAFIEGTVGLNAPDGQKLGGIQVTAIQKHPGFAHRSFISKALTDQDGKYRLAVIANTDVVMQVASLVKDTISSEMIELDKADFTVGAIVDQDFLVDPYPGPAIIYAKITANYIESQSVQVWEADQIDWRVATHFRLSAQYADGRTVTSGYPFHINAGVGEVVNVCVDGYEADLPKQCVEAIVEYSSEGEVVALGTLDLVQTGGIAKGSVVDAITGELINDWTGSLYLIKDGKLQSVNRNQHGIANRTKSSAIKLWLPEAGTYELRVTSGNKSYVRQMTVMEGQIIDLDKLQLTASGIFAGKANNELRIVESELVQGGKLNLRAMYTNNGSSAVDEAEVKIALPYGTTYVSGSVLWNNQVPTAEEVEIDDDFIVFKIGNIKAGGTGVVLLQIKADAVASLSDEIGTTAVIRYNHEGIQRDEVLGIAKVPVVQISLNAPAHTVNKNIMILGGAPAGSVVDVYVDQTILGRSIASPAGTWSMEVELPDHRRPAAYALRAVAEVDSQLLTSGNVFTLYNETYPHLTTMSMQQQDGRKITVDPRAGVAYFPYVAAGGSFTYEMTFNDPEFVSNVWVRMGPENDLREAKAIRGEDGIYRAKVNAPLEGPVYVDFDIDADQLPLVFGQITAYDLVNHHYSIPETILSTIEEELLAAATPEQVIVQGETFSWSYAEQEDIVITEEMLKRLVPVTANRKVYYAEKLGFTNDGDGFVMSVYGEELDDLNLFNDEAIAAFSSLSSSNMNMMASRAAPLAKLPLFKKGLWKVTKETSGPIRDVNNNSTSFDDAFQAFSELVTEAAAICDPILRVDAQRMLQRMRDERILAYELKVLVLAAPLNILGGIIIDNVKSAVYAEQVQLGRQLLDMWLENNKCEKKPLGTKALEPKFIHDPSGFVYEAVESNRVEGVQATLLYQDPAANNEWAVWDAEWYLQKNPHWTDANGKYGWDVPEGMWQVVYEKDGYEATYSQDVYGPIEVLPPHFDVNVPMVSYQSPEVVKVESKSDGKYVDITFSRYMALTTFGESAVLVQKVCSVGEPACTSESIAGTLTGAVVEQHKDGRELAITMRFTPNTAFTIGDRITITVQSMIQSYVGVPLEESYTTNVVIEKTPEEPIEPPGPTKPPGPIATPSPTYSPSPTTSPVITTKEYPIDLTIDQTIVVGDGQIVIQVPAGGVGSNTGDVYLSVESVEDGIQAQKLPNGALLVAPVQISLVAYDEARKKTVITGFLKPITVTVKLDPLVVNEENAGKVAAFIFEEGSWHYIQGTFDPTTNQYTLLQEHSGIITVMLTNKTFKDISGHWAQEIIEVMAGRLIIEGRTNELFAPEAPITRAEYVTLLMRVLNIPASQATAHQFEDVAGEAWHHDIVSAAFAEGLIAGMGDTTFGPNLSITREQIATLLQRAYDKLANNGEDTTPANTEATLGQFEDAGSISIWAKDSMSFAIRSGIIKGRSVGRLAPQATASRAEAGVMLQRFMDLMQDEINE